MKKVILSIGLSFCFSTLLFAQEQQPPAPPPTSPAPPPAPAPAPQQPAPAPQGTPSPLFTRNGQPADVVRLPLPFQPDPNAEVNPTELRVMMIQKYAQPLYRKPTDKELQKISPQPSLYSQYSEFLKRANTGVFRFAANKNCDTDTKVLVASEGCLLYTMPGAGSSYSFRTRMYRIQRLADVTFADGMFETLGILSHGIITDLGKLPIDNVTLNSDGMAYLVGFQPRTDGASAVAIDEQLRKGISENGHIYGRAAKVELDHTYALRSIAYRGKVMRSVQGASYNELDFDRRRDVIFAFRVVAMEPDGSVTVVWTELQNLESPKLKIEHSEMSSKEN